MNIVRDVIEIQAKQGAMHLSGLKIPEFEDVWRKSMKTTTIL